MQLVAAETMQRVRPFEAAAKLGVARSSVTRYLRQYPELLGQDGRVDWDEFRKHREDNPRIGGDKPTREQPAPARGPSRTDAKQRLEEANAQLKEIELARVAGRLLDADEVSDKITDIALALRDALVAPDQAFCDRLAAERDPRVVMAILRDHMKAALAHAIDALGKLQDGEEQVGAGEPA